MKLCSLQRHRDAEENRGLAAVGRVVFVVELSFHALAVELLAGWNRAAGVLPALSGYVELVGGVAGQLAEAGPERSQLLARLLEQLGHRFYYRRLGFPAPVIFLTNKD